MAPLLRLGKLTRPKSSAKGCGVVRPSRALIYFLVVWPFPPSYPILKQLPLPFAITHGSSVQVALIGSMRLA